jgi:hypothetical protein
MINHFKQRIPAFIDPRGIIPVEFDFETMEDLMSNSYIQDWITRGYICISKSGNFLMMSKEDISMSFAVGQIKDPNALHIPTYYARKKEMVVGKNYV